MAHLRPSPRWNNRVIYFINNLLIASLFQQWQHGPPSPCRNNMPRPSIDQSCCICSPVGAAQTGKQIQHSYPRLPHVFFFIDRQVSSSCSSLYFLKLFGGREMSASAILPVSAAIQNDRKYLARMANRCRLTHAQMDA